MRNKDNSHFLQRLWERAGIDLELNEDSLESLCNHILSFGEFVGENKKGDIYKYKFAGRTIYPVMSYDSYIITILSEDMVTKIIDSRRNNKKYA